MGVVELYDCIHISDLYVNLNQREPWLSLRCRALTRWSRDYKAALTLRLKGV